MPPATDHRAQQRALQRFRQEYNELRPHEALGQQTPASVYQPSARPFPARLPEPEYPDTMRVLSVRRQGHFRWQHHDVLLSRVLWGERVGLLPVDERWYTIYFAQFPLARFDSQRLRMLPLPKAKSFYMAGAGEEEVPPSPAPHPLSEAEEKVSGMSPV